MYQSSAFHKTDDIVWSTSESQRMLQNPKEWEIYIHSIFSPGFALGPMSWLPYKIFQSLKFPKLRKKIPINIIK